MMTVILISRAYAHNEVGMSRFDLLLLVAAIVCLTGHPVSTAAQQASGVIEALEAERPSKPGARAFKRVRSEDPLIRQILADGHKRSHAFRSLIDAIERSNLLVYVFWPVDLLSGMGGGLQVKGAANGQRVVFIVINRELSFVHVVPMIAHELQHAVEIANAPEVVDHASLVRYYERIGTPAGSLRKNLDTVAARAVEGVVRSELRAAAGMSIDDSSEIVADADGKRPPPAGEDSHTEQKAGGP